MHRNMLCQPSFFDILMKDLRLCIFLKLVCISAL